MRHGIEARREIGALRSVEFVVDPMGVVLPVAVVRFAMLSLLRRVDKNGKNRVPEISVVKSKTCLDGVFPG